MKKRYLSSVRCQLIQFSGRSPKEDTTHSKRAFLSTLNPIRGATARSINSRVFIIHMLATLDHSGKSDGRTPISLPMSSLPLLNLLCSSLKSSDTLFNPFRTEMMV